ncbi:kinetochore protein [Colletotrichum plurivorum]|uniref:Kinetochore protein n=1 Tax=Colletotrichum plurivorum TaxID=2175906 RepID=A0A8H6KY30_9PEZI|nr:kinetochore protein [Colletotrichum plurivorum]
MSSNSVPLATVTAQKQSFIANQTRLLSQAIHPSRTWLAANEASETPLPEPVIEHAVGRLNPILTQHSRRAYSYQASRHVAEQIEALYTSQPAIVPEDQPAPGIPLLMDFRVWDEAEDAAVKSLPPTWLATDDATMYPAESKCYSEQYKRLRSLADRRQQVRARVERLQRLRAILDPFRPDHAGAGVQENLVTREGEMEMEMERMRALLARVGGRVGFLPDSTEAGSLFREDDSLVVEPVTAGEKKKLESLLGSF